MADVQLTRQKFRSSVVIILISTALLCITVETALRLFRINAWIKTRIQRLDAKKALVVRFQVICYIIQSCIFLSSAITVLLKKLPVQSVSCEAFRELALLVWATGNPCFLAIMCTNAYHLLNRHRMVLNLANLVVFSYLAVGFFLYASDLFQVVDKDFFCTAIISSKLPIVFLSVKMLSFFLFFAIFGFVVYQQQRLFGSGEMYILLFKENFAGYALIMVSTTAATIISIYTLKNAPTIYAVDYVLQGIILYLLIEKQFSELKRSITNLQSPVAKIGFKDDFTE